VAQHSEESLDFVLEIARYRAAATESRPDIFRSIYHSFVVQDAKSWVNLPANVVRDLERRIEPEGDEAEAKSPELHDYKPALAARYPTGTFDRAYLEAVNLLRQNFWAEFRQTEGYLAFLRGGNHAPLSDTRENADELLSQSAPLPLSPTSKAKKRGFFWWLKPSKSAPSSPAAPRRKMSLNEKKEKEESDEKKEEKVKKEEIKEKKR